jgi:hypothetical protein
MAKTPVCNNETLRGTNLDVNDVVSLDSPSSEFNAYMSILVAIQLIYLALTR